MSHVILDEVEKVEGPEYRVGDLFRCYGDICILLRTEEYDDKWNLVPVLGDHDAFNDSWEWDKKTLEAQIRSGHVVRLPKGSSITIKQE